MIDVRVCRDEAEAHAALGAISHYFGTGVTPTWADRILPLLPRERVHGAWDDGTLVAGAGAFPLELTVPGAVLPTCGTTVVGVLPTHRRRGLLRQMMRAQLDDARARGEALAALWASEASIYGRFGFGVASMQGEIEVERSHAAFRDPVEGAGRARLVSAEEALELLPPLYDRVRLETPGMFARSRKWWELRTLADPESRRDGGGEMNRVVLEVDGDPQGYALYRVNPKFEHGSGVGFTSVIEAFATGPEATRALWRFLLDVDWMRSVRAWHIPVDHPLFLLVEEPRRLQYTVGDALWVRLLDVGAALSDRSYADDARIVLEVTDAFCPWNEGRWAIEGTGVDRTEADPELRLDVADLGSVYLGGFSFGQLARAGRLEELAEGAVGRADALFRTDRAPWCPEIF